MMLTYSNKYVFQWDAYRPLADRLSSDVEMGVYPGEGFLLRGGVSA